MRPMPTLADSLYRASLRESKRLGRFRDILTIPKFVLEDDVYNFMDGVMTGTLLTKPDRFRNCRLMSRMPYEKVWIEPSMDSATAWLKGEKTALGWYLERHPTLQTCVRMTLLLFDQRPEDNGQYRVAASHFSVVWSNDDGPATWPVFSRIGDQFGENPLGRLLGYKTKTQSDGPPTQFRHGESRTFEYRPGENIFGGDAEARAANSSVPITPQTQASDWVRPVFAAGHKEEMAYTGPSDTPWMEAVGDWGVMTYNEDGVGYEDNAEYQACVVDLYEHAAHCWLNAMVLFATIDELPVISREVKPSRGYFAKGKHRDFLQHRVVKLSIPVERATKKLANHLLSPSRRARHEVRGHWRRLTQDRMDTCPRYDHDWYVEDNHRLCLKCGGEGVHIKDHLRGDATIGFVTHDYSVERNKS